MSYKVSTTVIQTTTVVPDPGVSRLITNEDQVKDARKVSSALELEAREYLVNYAMEASDKEMERDKELIKFKRQVHYWENKNNKKNEQLTLQAQAIRALLDVGSSRISEMKQARYWPKRPLFWKTQVNTAACPAQIGKYIGLCYRCGKRGHKQAVCLAKFKLQCFYCGKYGHKFNVCRTRLKFIKKHQQ